jgi:hypothetical protein
MVHENYASVEILSRDVFISVQACTHNILSRIGCWVDPKAIYNLFDFKNYVYIFLAFYFIFKNSNVLVISWFQ